jgi:hypothetical protein
MKKYVNLVDGALVNVTEGKCIEVSVDYDKGNYYNSCRGIKLYIHEVTLKNSGMFRSVSFMVFSDNMKKFVIERLERKSAKRIAAAEKFVEDNLLEIVKMYVEYNNDGILNLISTRK